MAFPSSIPSYNGFTSTHTLSQDQHASQHNSEQADIVALATKIGTGAATPTNATVLRGNGTGTSAWGQVQLTSDASGILPQSNGGTGTSLATGTGSTVYQTQPTLTRPTISDFTNANHDHQSSAGGGTLTTAAIQDGAITPAKLQSGAGSSWAWIDYFSQSTITGWSAYTDQSLKYIQIGKTVIVNIGIGGTSNSTSVKLTIPIAAKNNGSGITSEMATGLAEDNGTIDTSPGRIYIDATASATTINVTRTGGTGSWTASGTKLVRGIYIYEAA